jgi:hypothetical protein
MLSPTPQASAGLVDSPTSGPLTFVRGSDPPPSIPTRTLPQSHLQPLAYPSPLRLRKREALLPPRRVLSKWPRPSLWLPIISAQHMVSGVAATAPSGAERAQACIRQSTTHGPSRKEVVVITVPPVHWPEKPVIQVVNSFLGQHKLANRVVSEAQRHLGGLTLVLASVPLQADTDTLHLFFDRKSKEAAGENAVTCVEVGASRSYMHIRNFPYYGAGTPQPDPVNGGYLPVTPQAVNDLILSTPWKSGINFFQDGLPHIERSSSHSDTCTVYFDIYDSRGGLRLHALKGHSFMYGAHELTFRASGYPSAQSAGGSATVLWCAPSTLNCALTALVLIIQTTTVS